ncbi:ankyrin repeat domain-containing protein [Candidatus Chromulinivorax destructor]|uniref:Uncharacterized protein n=1 Tax=Candidatus Chromulinivorax destructor TaxID=2066483 RepID=A0A345ZB30_9BACT|nr:ankyrin repeat domain-containing protein [Candidatus Chromulinivorax destructor]AXK60497.1 hypothetical protein C0J27_01900 [Candidatus Chromulinivorax destructor]
MKLIKKLELMIIVCVCIKGSLIFASQALTPIFMPDEQFKSFVNDDDVVKAYLDGGGNPNIYNLLGRFVYKNNFEIVTRLISAGADVNLAQPLYPGDGTKKIIGYYSSPLHAAIKSKSLDMVKLLVEHGANIYKGDLQCQTAIDLAITQSSMHANDLNRLEIKKILENLSFQQTGKWPVNSIPKIQFDRLLNDNGALKAYVEEGGNPNILMMPQEAYLDEEACLDLNMFGMLQIAAGDDKFDIVTLLLNAGADIDLGYNATPLHDAIANESLSMVKLLVTNGADVNKQNMCGQSSIEFANIKLQEDPENQKRLAIKSYLDEVDAYSIVSNTFTDEIPTAIGYPNNELGGTQYPVAHAEVRP